METYSEIKDWVKGRLDDTTTAMDTKIGRYVHTILSPQYLGVKYTWNLNATVWTIASGASNVGLPSLMADYNKDVIWNETFDNPLRYVDRRQYAMHDNNSGVVELYRRQGQNFVFNAAGKSQNIYFEWYPQHASLASNGAIPLVPNKLAIAEGALMLAWEDMGKDKRGRAQQQAQKFYTMKNELEMEDGNILESFEDPDYYGQEG